MTVCDKWLNFQNFAEWFYKNYYEIDNEAMCLDKDILHKGNKIYGPETCIYCPKSINGLFVKCDSIRGECPIGVNKLPNGRFRAYHHIYINNKRIIKHLGVFDTPEEAFNIYKQAKEKYIKQVADSYKYKIPKKLYDAMYNWKVEITD